MIFQGRAVTDLAQTLALGRWPARRSHFGKISYACADLTFLDERDELSELLGADRESPMSLPAAFSAP
jgi:hypothetical protein